MNKKNFSKRGLEMSFGWLFAIIAGAVILFVAIYFAAKYINLQQTAGGAETGKQIEILLDPLETSFESATTTSFSLPLESRIYNICDDYGNFGKQEIKLGQKSFNQWKNSSIDVSFENKYIFSESGPEGKSFFVFSKPFYFPFKVADLIYLTSANEEYCFENPPPSISEELGNLNQSNIIVDNGKGCRESGIKVCFGSSICNINVVYSNNGESYVKKGNDKLYFYSDALMYAAVFSGKSVYECQVKRLMERTDELASLYENKLSLISKEGCPVNMQNELAQLDDYAKGFQASGDITTIGNFADNLNQENSDAICMIW